MYQSVERYVNFLAKNYLTQDQFLMLYLLRNKDYESINKFKTAFPKLDGSMIGEEYKKDLIDRGFIKKVGEGTSMNEFEVTDKFNHIFLQNHFIAADEIWRLYPSYVRIGDKNIPLKIMDVFQFANLYAARINNSVDEHLEVVRDISFALQNDLIKCNIENFVKGELWKQIREIRLKQTIIKEVSNLTDQF